MGTPDEPLGGSRADLEVCAESAPAADSTADHRLLVMTCAGAFFKPHD